ncbi:MAG: RNA export factor, nucleoporin Rae1 [Piptocephalis tieghemiana]|nr:MAG: RNA export factor, nucleoporin Rae1 [Piptocephalis tieghemiana]
MNPAMRDTFEVANSPPDGISSLHFSSQADYLLASSWDNNVRIYEILQSGQANAKAMYAHDGPVLQAQWSPDGGMIASGGCDKAIKLYDINSGQSRQLGTHDQPVSCVRWVEPSQGQSILATASWDKTLKYWDPRQPNPAMSLTLPERAYCMDTKKQLLVVGTAERHSCIINLSNPSTIFKDITVPLKFQTRSVACFNDGAGFAIGSIEGRAAIQYVDESKSSSNFTFKCQRNDNQIFPVNAISVNPVHGTMSTAGADGTYNFWDKDAKIRLKFSNNVGGPISCSAFSRSGVIFAYAISYDWSKGYTGADGKVPNKIMLHACKDEDIKPRGKGPKR